MLFISGYFHEVLLMDNPLMPLMRNTIYKNSKLNAPFPQILSILLYCISLFFTVPCFIYQFTYYCCSVVTAKTFNKSPTINFIFSWAKNANVVFCITGKTPGIINESLFFFKEISQLKVGIFFMFTQVAQLKKKN